MEESAKRKERLVAMRMEAAQATVDSGAVFNSLSNPLIETSATRPVQEEPCVPQRFDFYTDPMAAFSGNKRNKVINQIPQDTSTTPKLGTLSTYSFTGAQNAGMPPPALQGQIDYSSKLRMHQAREPYPSYGPPNTAGMTSPYGTQPATPQGAWSGPAGTPGYCFPSNSPRGGNYTSPGYGQGGSPGFNPGQGRGHWYNSSSGPGSGRGGSPNFDGRGRGHWFSGSPGPSGLGGSPGPNLGQGGSPNFNSGQGRGHWYNNSPGPGSGPGGSPGVAQGGSTDFNPGRGRGQWFSNSPGPGSGRGGSPHPNSGRGRGQWLGNNVSPVSGRSGGRGRGSHYNVSAELRPDRYYNKSMMEDPWKFLEPVIWKPVENLNIPDSPKSWLPKSISTKRERISGSPGKSSSKPSLAEFLAASFNEAASSEATTDEPSP
ncbi:hypothetical protein RJ639_041191 [Escallonia herrerae]|uniref:Uncharacterized protein n=1 Tax=Escallonia herrerae TaxID=1293975 RepID=A0AA88WFR9_9ASTE|nr:hypothetical protein RJ639_041191 [Escallonia herrerae]